MTEQKMKEQKLGIDFVISYPSSGKPRKRISKLPDKKVDQSYGDECNTHIVLDNIDDLDNIDNALFMMETSGSSRLKPRQACGIESAARKVYTEYNMLLL